MRAFIYLLLPLLVLSRSIAAEPLERQFQNPPEETKPWCYWYWLNSDISRDGITKDLETMSKAEIRLKPVLRGRSHVKSINRITL